MWYEIKSSIGGFNFMLSLSDRQEIELGLQLVTKYLRLTLVFVWISALREEFNFCFSRVFC